jgi:hypothetical protein
MPQPDLLDTLPGPTLRNSRHWMIRNTQDQWYRNQVGAGGGVAGFGGGLTSPQPPQMKPGSPIFVYL